MNKTNPFIKSIRESTVIRLSLLFGSFFILLLVTTILTSSINLSQGSERTHLLIASCIQSVLAFCVPAILLARFSSNNWRDWLYLTKAPQFKALAGVILLYLISMPAMEWLIEWNSNIHLPESLSSLEKVLRNLEENAEQSAQVILGTNSITGMLLGVLIIGVLTGFSEEMFFRGGLQGIFTRGPMKKATAIWTVAIVFSFMHFQFFGFVPRLLMGAFFGYLLVWTRNLWVPVFAHALNNSIVVVTAYFTGDPSASLLELSGQSENFYNMPAVLVSLILTVLFFVFFRNYIFKYNPKWQRNQLPSITGK